MINRKDFPYDDDGEVLYRLAIEGIDLNCKRNIDFSCYAVDFAIAQAIINDLASYGYKARIFVDDDEGGTGNVSVYAGMLMLPDYELLVIEQKRLNAILRFYETSCDGWVTRSS